MLDFQILKLVKDMKLALALLVFVRFVRPLARQTINRKNLISLVGAPNANAYLKKNNSGKWLLFDNAG